METMASDLTWLDHVQAWSTVAATIVAGVGLLAVYLALRKDERQARIGAGPYVRVDVFPVEVLSGDFAAPKPYYETESSLVDLAEGLADDRTSTFAASFRNYQSNPLGTAFRVAAFFVLEIRREGSNETEYRYSIVAIPYVEHEKPVTLHLFRIPQDCSATVWLSRLAFSDFYDSFHEHSEGSDENALHGRLTCVYDIGKFQSIPEGRPAGKWSAR